MVAIGKSILHYRIIEKLGAGSPREIPYVILAILNSLYYLTG